VDGCGLNSMPRISLYCTNLPNSAAASLTPLLCVLYPVLCPVYACCAPPPGLGEKGEGPGSLSIPLTTCTHCCSLSLFPVCAPPPTNTHRPG
jgi:hypothetical protein